MASINGDATVLRELGKQVAALATCVGLISAAGETTATERGWPHCLGPYFNNSAVETGVKLVDDPQKGKLLWVSEDSISGVGNYSKTWPAGSYSGPVVQNGRVYVYYYVATHQHHMLEAPDELYHTPPMTSADFGADDIVHCFDAETGRTLWRNAYRYKGVWYERAKQGGHYTPVLHDGKLYAIGTTARIYCIDAETGETLWEGATGGAKHAMLEGSRGSGVRGKMPWFFAPTGVPVVIDGVLINNDAWSSLVAHHPATGALAWKRSEAVNVYMMPLPYMLDGRAHALSHNCLLDVGSGERVWGSEKDVSGSILPIKYNDMVLGMGDPEQQEVACYKVKQTGLEPLWTVSVDTGREVQRMANLVGFSAYTIYRDHLYFRVAGYSPNQVCVDMRTGRIVAQTAAPTDINSTFMAAEGRLIWLSANAVHMMNADPKDFRELGTPFETPWANCSDTALVDGRVYFRGPRDMRCVDLRANAPQPKPVQPWSGADSTAELLATLKSPYLRDRQKAAKALCTRADAKEAVPALIDILKEGYWPAVEPAAHALRAVWEPDATYAPGLESAAREALRKRRFPLALLLAGLVRECREGAGEGLGQDLAPLVKSEDPNHVSAALEIVRTLGPGAAPTVPALVSLLFAPNPDWRAEFAIQWRILPVLATVGPRAKGAIPQLRALKNGDMRDTSYARLPAALALVGIDPASRKECLVVLERFMRGEERGFNTSLARTIIQCLTDIAVSGRDPAFRNEVVGILTMALTAPDGPPILKSDAIHHLGRLGSDATFAAKAIQRAGLDGRLQSVAQAALEKIAPNAKPVKWNTGPTLDMDGDLGLDL